MVVAVLILKLCPLKKKFHFFVGTPCSSYWRTYVNLLSRLNSQEALLGHFVIEVSKVWVPFNQFFIISNLVNHIENISNHKNPFFLLSAALIFCFLNLVGELSQVFPEDSIHFVLCERADVLIVLDCLRLPSWSGQCFLLIFKFFYSHYVAHPALFLLILTCLYAMLVLC